MERQVQIIKYERKIATSKNKLKILFYKILIKILNGSLVENEIRKRDANEIRNIDKEFYECYVYQDDLEKDEIKENYKLS